MGVEAAALTSHDEAVLVVGGIFAFGLLFMIFMGMLSTSNLCSQCDGWGCDECDFTGYRSEPYA